MKENSNKHNFSFLPGKFKSHWYFNVDENMMMNTSWPWEANGSDGKGDALWRTGLAYIAWKYESMKVGLLSCFRKVKSKNKKDYKYQAMRFPGGHGEEDVSRDQVIMGLAGLLIVGDKDEAKEIVSHLPYKLSKKYSMTPSMWFWTKSIQGSKFWGNVFCISQCIILPPSILWNKLCSLVCGFKSVPAQEYNPVDVFEKREGFNFIQKIFDDSFWPSYARHLLAWQFYTLELSEDNIFRKAAQRMLIDYIENDNYLLRILLKDKSITHDEVYGYENMDGFRWSMRCDGSRTAFFNGSSQEYRDEMYKHNRLDQDVLMSIYEKEKKS